MGVMVMEDGMNTISNAIRRSYSHYRSGEYLLASSTLNKAHVSVYEATTQFRDLEGGEAIAILTAIQQAPTVSEGEDWWMKSYRDTLRAVRELVEDYLRV